LRREVYRGWVEAVEEEQRAGRLPADLDAAQLVLSEICLAMGPFLIPQVTQLVTGMSVKDPEFVAQRQEFLRRLGARLDDRSTAARA
jgi:TetR/AcrR family transcriptional regulator